MGYSEKIRGHLELFSRSMRELREEIEAGEHLETGSFSIGIEEEYFLVDAETREVSSETPDALFAEAFAGTDGRIEREMLQAQAETVTRPCTSLSQARAELRFARSVLSAVAASHGLAILAAGTHPTASWRGTVQTAKERYDKVMNDLQMIGERNMLCGMHVHVSLPDPTRRVDIMRRILPYLPLFIALSTSSPFWQSRATGLRGYRLAAYDELPRTGLPELFRDEEDLDAYCQALVRAGAIPDSSHIWWAIRPSLKYPTLELRAADSCTHIEDALAIAALYRVLVRHLYVNPECNADIDAVARAVAVENKWRAQRYGVHGSFATPEGPLTVGEFLDKAIALTAEDAKLLGCAREIEHCRQIVLQGTSADAQIGLYQAHSLSGSAAEAFAPVLNWLAENTAKVG
jgi:carboxylate-amine ligase